uniref:Si:dkey-21a6.5 n=1 Tax=Cynoglossus semilaevis TaxID=244447 RepID=A0A3P8UFN3_CYNSE
MVGSQTTLSPAVTSTTLIQNVTSLSPTTAIVSSTTQGCSEFNTSTCEPCAPGSRYDNTLLCACCSDPGLCLFPGACLACGRGFYQPLAGQQQCLPCNRGTYTSSGCSRCQMCPGGTEALQIAAKDCTPCRPMHKAPHQALCQICGSGFYQIHWGQESCTVCPENHYCPSPDVNPILCPSDAFCPEGSSAPGYCMETFFRKSGDTCELAPVTIALLVIAALLFIILIIVRRRQDTDGELTIARTPLLCKERPQGRYYGFHCDAEPVYAGW